jgi:HAD superfamily hydrolase (TIGR01450 family)
MFALSRYKLIILDIDGVISIAGRPIAGARTAIDQLTRMGFLLRYLTNDAFNTRVGRASLLSSIGFNIPATDIYTAASLTGDILRRRPSKPRTLFIGRGDAEVELSGVRLVHTNPEVVVIGDCAAGISIDLLNAGMQGLKEGAEFLAMQRNRTFPGPAGSRIDCGLWVVGLEYCVRRKATVIGKPSKDSYLRICNDCSVLPAEALMVSDSADPDLRGAKAAGLFTVHLTIDSSSARSTQYVDLRLKNLTALAASLASLNPKVLL